MTILIGIVMGKIQDNNSFAIIGSDSKSVEINVYQNRITKEITRTEVLSVNNNSKKVFRISKNVIVGFAGNGFGMDQDELYNYLIKDFKDEKNLEKSALHIKKEINKIAKESQNDIFSYEVIVGGYIEDRPALASFKTGLYTDNIPIEYRIPRNGEVLGFFCGQKVPDYLKAELNERIRKGNGSMTSVRLAITDYIKRASVLFPDNCNDIVQIERIR